MQQVATGAPNADLELFQASYNRARYYDPLSGRFISEDRIRFWGGTNFYRYANNDPIGYADSFGMFPGPMCLYYIYKCAQTAQQCRLDLDKASGGPYNPNGDTAFVKARIPKTRTTLTIRRAWTGITTVRRCIRVAAMMLLIRPLAAPALAMDLQAT